MNLPQQIAVRCVLMRSGTSKAPHTKCVVRSLWVTAPANLTDLKASTHGAELLLLFLPAKAGAYQA